MGPFRDLEPSHAPGSPLGDWDYGGSVLMVKLPRRANQRPLLGRLLVG